MTLLRRRKPARMGMRTAPQLRCPSHLAWVRGFACAIEGRYGEKLTKGGLVHIRHECEGRMQAAHVRTGTDGGTGVKPSDCHAIPLCALAHKEQHDIGEAAFEKRWGISMRKIADDLWRRSPHRLKVEA